jgi:hypothetical protein
VIPGAPFTYYVKGRWTAAQLLNHSTTLETAGSNVGLLAALLRCPPGDIVEAFDSQAATLCGRRLSCRASTMCDSIRQRGDILDAVGRTRRCFLFFFHRELNQIADDGSKDLMTTVAARLAERGFAPPQHWHTSPSPLTEMGTMTHGMVNGVARPTGLGATAACRPRVP